MSGMSDMFLRERGKPLNRLETLQEKAAKHIIEQVPNGATMGPVAGRMINEARSKAWGRQSRQSALAWESESTDWTYVKAVVKLARRIVGGEGDFKDQVERMHHLTDPHTYKAWMTGEGFPEHPEQTFDDYETAKEREFRLEGTAVHRDFSTFLRQALGTPYQGSSRSRHIAEVQHKYSVSKTAAISILADLVDKFEKSQNRPALLS